MRKLRPDNLIKAAIISLIRALLGERGLKWIHALRFMYLIKRETYTEHEMALIPMLLNEGDAAIDVGANGANWTYELSKSVGKTGIVYAFEADPYYADVTKITCKMMGMNNVSFFKYGLSDKSEIRHLRIKNGRGVRLQGQSNIVQDENVSSEYSTEIMLKKLDDLSVDHPDLKNVRLVKCDVEGYEMFVLRGAKQIIQNSRCVIILEIGHGQRYGYEPKEIYSFLQEYGYESYFFTGAFPELADGDQPSLEAGKGNNFIFVHKDEKEGYYGLMPKLRKIHHPQKLQL